MSENEKKKNMYSIRRTELLPTQTTERNNLVEKSLSTTFDRCDADQLNSHENHNDLGKEEEDKLLENNLCLDRDKVRTSEIANNATDNQINVTELKQSSLFLQSLSTSQEEQKEECEEKEWSDKNQLKATTTSNYKNEVQTTTNDSNTTSATKNCSIANPITWMKSSQKINLPNPLLKFHTLPLKKQFDRIEREFTLLEQQTMNPRKYKFNTSFKYAALNRYMNIFANEETLFPPRNGTNNFARPTSESGQGNQHAVVKNNDNNNNNSSANKNTNNINEFYYINGNLVDLKVQPLFVASQAPVVDGFYAFWHTIYNCKISLILMLTHLDEGGLVKADRYWPEDNVNGNDESTPHNNCNTNSCAKFAASASNNATSKTLTFGDITVSTDPSEPSWYDSSLHLFYRPLLVTLNNNSGIASSDDYNCCRSANGTSNNNVKKTSPECCTSSCDISSTNSTPSCNKVEQSGSNKGNIDDVINSTTANCGSCQNKSAKCISSTNCSNQSLSKGHVHRVMHVQYTGWPDQGVPHTTASFEALLNEIKKYVNEQSSSCSSVNVNAEQSKACGITSSASSTVNNDDDIKIENTSIKQNNIAKSNAKLSFPPVLVHCSAGIGRTGTLIGAYAAIALLEQNKLTDASMMHIVSSMRRARYGMVQRIEQYMFMYQIVMHYMGIDVNDFAASLTCRAEDYYYHMMYNRSMSKRERRNSGLQ